MTAPEQSIAGGPLALVDTWEAGFAAAAAVDAHGRPHRHGDTSQVLRVASITKLVTAWAVLVAVEEGTLALEDPAGPPGSTVRHLLCHAAGLDFDSGVVLAAPAQRRIYSSTGYERLADLLAERSGMPFADYLAEAVLQPLGMGHSELRGSPAKDLHSSVEDLLRFTEELRRPTLVHASTAEESRRAQWPDLPGVLPGWGQMDPCPWGLGARAAGRQVAPLDRHHGVTRDLRALRWGGHAPVDRPRRLGDLHRAVGPRVRRLGRRGVALVLRRGARRLRLSDRYWGRGRSSSCAAC